MDNVEMDVVLRETAERLEKLGRKPKRHPADKHLPTPYEVMYGGDGHSGALNHALWMCHEAGSWPADKLEKKQRWLGFIQGVLWVTGVQTIETSKRDNE